MVVIKKGKLTKTVTLSSFHNYYENSGWELTGENVINNRTDVNEEFDDLSDVGNEEEIPDSEWDDVMEEEVEKPLSEMNRTELEAKAASLGVDISGLTKNAQIREKIKSVM